MLGPGRIDRGSAAKLPDLLFCRRNQATIFCNAITGYCMLTDSLLRMVALMRPQWGGALPFSIICFSPRANYLARNQRDDAVWMKVGLPCPLAMKRQPQLPVASISPFSLTGMTRPETTRT